MIDLKEYKKILIEPYHDKINIEELDRQLNSYYGDEYLQRIIDGTYQFIKELTDPSLCKLNENGQLILNETQKHTGDIYFLIDGHGTADRLFFDNDGKMISYKIMEDTFGNGFRMYYSERDVWRESEIDDEDWWDIEYSLNLELPENLEEIRNELFCKQRKLGGNNLV